MSSLNPYSIIPFITGISTGGLGFFCFKKNHSSRPHRLFFLLCLAITPWPLALSVILNLTNPEQVIWWTKVGHSTCALAPPFLLDFVVTFLHRGHLRWLVRACYANGICALLVMSFTNVYLNPSEIYRYSWGPYAKASLFATIDALAGCLAVTVAFFLMVHALKQASPRTSLLEYSRLRYLALATSLVSFGMLDYLPKYGVSIPPVGSFFLLSFAVIVTYAIVRHQILDFAIAIRRTAVYSILAACVTASYLVVVLVMEKWFQGFFGYRSLIATALTGFAITLGFIPLKNRVQMFVDRYFFHGSQEELALENEQLRKEVQQTDRLKAVATFAAGMAHEVKNPLSSIKAFTEHLPQRYDDQEFRDKFVRIVGQEVDKMNTLVQRLLEFAKPVRPVLAPVQVSQVVKETLDFLQGTLLQKRIQTETHFADHDTVMADAGQLKQVLLNVTLNSLEAMPSGGSLLVETTTSNGHVEVVVTDSGHGIAKKDLPHIFDPFYTTKRHGTGLGLSVVHGLIREHGGRIAVASEAGKGTTVRICLPVNFTGGTNGASAHPHRG